MGAEKVCRVLLPGACAGLSFLEALACVACPKPLAKRVNIFNVPLLTCAATAPWRRSHVGASNAPYAVISRTVRFDRCRGGGGIGTASQPDVSTLDASERDFTERYKS